jgi:hypothetical protein
MFGFNRLNNFLKSSGNIKNVDPVFVIHDAIVLDVHNDDEKYIPKMCEVGSINIEKFAHTNFFLKVENPV